MAPIKRGAPKVYPNMQRAMLVQRLTHLYKPVVPEMKAWEREKAFKEHVFKRPLTDREIHEIRLIYDKTALPMQILFPDSPIA